MPGEKLTLKANHSWKCKPGNSICVIDRGVVRFEYPTNWIVEPSEGSLHLHDRPPSVESCDLGVSVFPIPREAIQHLSLKETLLASLESEWNPYHQSEIHHAENVEVEIVWLEQQYIDAEHKRDARFRVAVARGSALCLISFNYWSDRASQLEQVWDEVLRSLVFGVMIKDPTAGPTLQ